MLYHVKRNGENYGPYTVADLQRYVASGNVLLSDLAKTDEMAEWVPVSQVLGAAVPAGPMAVTSEAAYPMAAGLYPDPPNLHWALVLLLGMVTLGLFIAIWDFVQAVWMRRVNPRSNALFLYIAYFVVAWGGTFGRLAFVIASRLQHRYTLLGLAISLTSLLLLELARFDMRRSLEEHFNNAEPMGLSLSGIMTFFFGSIYFQYHLTRINEVKRLARYRGAAI